MGIKLEDLQQNFPKMPQELRTMVEQEVQKQIGNKIAMNRKGRMRRMKKSFILILAAAMLLGTTVFATIAYRMHSESVGTYAVKTKIEKNENDSSEIAQTNENPITFDIPDITMEVSYLPDGMVKTEEGKYSYTDAMYKGGVSIVFYKMDTGDAQFEMLTTNVKETDPVNIGGYEGVYFALQTDGGEDISFTQRIYVAYTDVHYVMEMYAASDVSKEEALKIAEGIHLQPVTNSFNLETSDKEIVNAYLWSEFIASNYEEVSDSTGLSIPAQAMKNTHTVGEAFAANPQKEDPALENVEIKVTDVQIFDTVNLLNLSAMDNDFREELQSETTPSGELLPTTINYIRYGDGINSVNEVVESRNVPQKLVYVTVEYTNQGAEELQELLFFGSLMKFVEEDGEVKCYDGKMPGQTAVWDEAVLKGAAHHVEMWYYDVHGGEQGNNYISRLMAGETATVHMAWLVPEEELAYLYLNLDTYGDSYELSEHSLEVGYVDIRQ